MAGVLKPNLHQPWEYAGPKYSKTSLTLEMREEWSMHGATTDIMQQIQ